MGALEGQQLRCCRRRGLPTEGIHGIPLSSAASRLLRRCLRPALAGPIAGPIRSEQLLVQSVEHRWLGITDSSQGGGGIFVHGWGHNIQIANNRISNNTGTLTGGISVGQGEFPPAYTQGGATNAAPGSCQQTAY